MFKQTKTVENQNNLKELCYQVKLKRGNQERVMWANADKVMLGEKVKVEEDDGTWSENWTIDEIYGNAVPKSIINHRSHEHATYRKRNDY